MIKFTKSKKKFNKLIETKSFTSLFNSRNGSHTEINNLREVLIKISSWREKTEKVFLPLSPLFKDNVKKLSVVLGEKPAFGLILGSEKLVTKIWILEINNNPYILYYNKNGLSIEGDCSLKVKDLTKDLKELKSYMKSNIE